MIFESNGKTFGVSFIKKDGTIRVMNARKGVKKGVVGVGLKYDPKTYNLIPVFDMVNDGFRMINATTIQSLNIAGNKFEVV